jgi:hypothetical protein
MPPVDIVNTVDLGPERYQASIKAFRLQLETPGAEFFDIGVRTPKGETIQLQVRRQNAYIVGFKGATGWYSFTGEEGARGPSCGTGANYNDLGLVGKITYDDLNALAELGRFAKGVPLNKRLIAIVIAMTSEAARFATVATYFVGLTNSVGTAHSAYLPKSVDFDYLRNTYFKQWENPPRIEMVPGRVYHYVRPEGEILLPHKK